MSNFAGFCYYHGDVFGLCSQLKQLQHRVKGRLIDAALELLTEFMKLL